MSKTTIVDWAYIPTIQEKTTTWKEIREAIVGVTFVLLVIYMAACLL